jgi:hypothetical protein
MFECPPGVIDTQAHRVVVTAAHCVGDQVISCNPLAYTEERTRECLLGHLGKTPTVWAECLFIDPIADIAVLGAPDSQAYYDEADAYDAMVNEAATLSIADAPEQGRAWLLSLKGQWYECKVRRSHAHNSLLNLSGALENITGGMSGSPILADDGSAIGLVSTDNGPAPRLSAHLPGWMLKEIGLVR